MTPGILLILLTLQEAPPPQEPPPAESTPTWIRKLRGTISARHRTRWTGDQSDVDLYQFITLSYGDPDADPVSASASARFAEDLDGEHGVDGYFEFDSIDDTYKRSSTSRLYTAYVDVNRVVDGLLLRGGRQVLMEFPEAVPLDGGRLQFEAWETLEVGAFAGRPVNLFESSPDGDLMYGGWLATRPWDGARAQAEYLHLEDENVFGMFDDDLVGLSLEQRAGPWILIGRHTWLEGESRESTARASTSIPGADLVIDARGTYQHERQQALSYAVDPYSVFLFDLEPYVQYMVRAAKNFGNRFGVDATFSARELTTDSDERAYNHEYYRASLSPHVSEWPFPGLSISVSGDYWKSSADDFWTASGDVSCKLHPDVTVGAGTGYALYTIDSFTGEERERVRSVTTSLKWKLSGSLRLRARLTYERNDVDTFGTFEVGVRHVF